MLVSGDCSLIITQTQKTILIDGGNNSDYDYGENVVMPYLLKHGIYSIDYVIISHFDSDHYGGTKFILENMKVKNVVIGKQFETSENLEEFLKIIKDKKINLNIVEAGDKINIEKNLYFDVLWPDFSNVINTNIINNNSLVCKLNYKNTSILFTGDIGLEAEKALISKYSNENILKSTILKVAHHGSSSSTTQEFLKIVAPKICLIGVGKNNKFGHPNEEVIKRLEDMRN
jgi:competence protein ComEC